MKTASLLALSFLSASTLAQTNATIQGHVNSIPLNHPTANAKVLVKKTNGELVDSTVTDSNGNYFKNITVTSVNPITGLPDGFALSQNYPNPFNPSTKAQVEVPRMTTVHVGVYDILGQEVAKQDYAAQPGVLDVWIDGLGAAGIYFLRTTTEDGFSGTIKMIKMDGGISRPALTINQVLTVPERTYSFGKPDVDPDSLDVVFSKQGYITLTERVPFSTNMTLNADLEKTPTVTDFKVRPFNVRGEEIDSITVKYVTSDSVRFFQKQSDGFIHVNWNDYKETPDTTAMMMQLNTNYSPWIIGRKPRQASTETNIYQNGKLPVGVTQLDTTIVPLNILNSPAHKDSSYLYLMPEWHQRGNGQWVSFNDSMWVLIDNRFAPGTEKFIADNVDFLVFSYNLSTGLPISQQYLNQMYARVNDQLSKFVLANSDTLQRFTVHQVNSTTDSIYLACQARDWDNVVFTYRFNTPVPGNTLQLDPSGRIKNGTSLYGVVTNNNLAAEVHGSLTTSGDGLGGQGSATYIVKSDNSGDLNDLGSDIMRFLYLSDKDVRGFGIQR